MKVRMQLVHILFVLLIAPFNVAAQKFSSLDLTLKLAQDRAYLSVKTDWIAVEEEAQLRALNQGEDAAIKFVLKSLGDRHSFYRPAAKPVFRPSLATNLKTANYTAPTIVRALFEVKEPIYGVPVLKINGWSGTQQDAMIVTSTLRLALINELSKSPCGIILDFSENTGGNMWPMLIGLSPLLTEGIVGYFKYASGTVKAIEKKSSGIFIQGSRHVLNDASTLEPINQAQFIAIVVGANSASSGEIVPIMFHGQKNVRFFGQRTFGVPTVNSTFKLPNGGFANITTGVTLDRNNNLFETHIDPEIETRQPLKDAAMWGLKQCQS